VHFVLRLRHQNDQVRANIAEFERSTQKVETRAAKILAERVKEVASDFAAELQSGPEETARKSQRKHRWR
jgi:hypothetical protein